MEEDDEEEEDHERKIRIEVTRGIVAGLLEEVDVVGRGVTRNTVSAIHSINVKDDSIRYAQLGGERQDEWKEIEQRVRQNWDCSQIEDSFEKKEMLWTGIKTVR